MFKSPNDVQTIEVLVKNNCPAAQSGFPAGASEPPGPHKAIARRRPTPPRPCLSGRSVVGTRAQRIGITSVGRTRVARPRASGSPSARARREPRSVDAEEDLAASWLALCLHFRQQLLKVRSGQERLEIGLFRHLGDVFEATIDGLSQGGQGAISIGRRSLLPFALGQPIVGRGQPGAPGEQTRGRVGIARQLDGRLEELSDRFGGGRVVLPLQERLGHSPAIVPVELAIVRMAWIGLQGGLMVRQGLLEQSACAVELLSRQKESGEVDHASRRFILIPRNRGVISGQSLVNGERLAIHFLRLLPPTSVLEQNAQIIQGLGQTPTILGHDGELVDELPADRQRPSKPLFRLGVPFGVSEHITEVVAVVSEPLAIPRYGRNVGNEFLVDRLGLNERFHGLFRSFGVVERRA